MAVQQKQEVWARLFADASLGAGNFFFKAYDAYPDKHAEFISLEMPYVGPSGIARRSFSLESLHVLVAELAGWYLQRKLGRGAQVCLYLGDGIPSFLHFLALNSIGCVPVLINGHVKSDIAAAYARINGFSTMVYDRETDQRWHLDGAFPDLTTFNAGFVENRAEPVASLDASDWPVTRHGDDTVMICHSSGTTGIPKAVLFGHDQFFMGKRERLQSFAEVEDERLATAMPGTHAAGISYLMTAVLLQFKTLALSTQTGPVVAEQIGGFRATIVTAFSQTYASLAEQQLPDGYLHTVQRFYNTGDTAHGAHIRELLRLAPQARFTDMFGASELGMSQFFKVSRAGDIASPRTVGAPAPYAQCAVLAPDGAELPDGVPGYFGVRSPTVTPGYHGQPHLTALTTLNGYWLTGDVGLRKGDGEFVHLDRIVDVVDTAFGEPAYTLLLEEHLLKFDGVFDVAVTGVSRGPTREESVLVLVQPVKGADIDPETLLRHVLSCYPFQGQASLPDYTVCIGILAAGFTLPLGSTGKVLKRLIRDSFWSWQREFDEQARDKFVALLWNHLTTQSLPPGPARGLLDHVLAV